MSDEKADEDLAGLKTEEQDEYDVDEPVLDAGKQLGNKPENVGIGTSAFLTSSRVKAHHFLVERDLRVSSCQLIIITTLLLVIDLEQELADYNGDDENEGEFEADKQAVLSQDWGTRNPQTEFPPWKWADCLVCVAEISWMCRCRAAGCGWAVWLHGGKSYSSSSWHNRWRQLRKQAALNTPQMPSFPHLVHFFQLISGTPLPCVTRSCWGPDTHCRGLLRSAWLKSSRWCFCQITSGSYLLHVNQRV